MMRLSQLIATVSRRRLWHSPVVVVLVSSDHQRGRLSSPWTLHRAFPWARDSGCSLPPSDVLYGRFRRERGPDAAVPGPRSPRPRIRLLPCRRTFHVPLRRVPLVARTSVVHRSRSRAPACRLVLPTADVCGWGGVFSGGCLRLVLVHDLDFRHLRMSGVL